MGINDVTVNDVIQRLPDQVSGPNWLCFVSDVLDDACSALNNSDESVQDWQDGIIERLTPPLHKGVWQLCHDLSLWANDTIDEMVSWLGKDTCELTTLCRRYVHAALILVSDAVVSATSSQR